MIDSEGLDLLPVREGGIRGEKLAGRMPAVTVHVNQRGLQTPPSWGFSEVQLEWGRH